jgi:hypothetical protein
MRVYCYDEPSVDQVQEITEGEILKEFWPWWYQKMVDKYGEGHELITEQNCIEDWCTIHWAWEKR